VGLTGAIRVSFDTSYGKECLIWLIGLAVYITLRADKDNTLPFWSSGAPQNRYPACAIAKLRRKQSELLQLFFNATASVSYAQFAPG
jgi:hypothetical protein